MKKLLQMIIVQLFVISALVACSESGCTDNCNEQFLTTYPRFAYVTNSADNTLRNACQLLTGEVWVDDACQ